MHGCIYGWGLKGTCIDGVEKCGIPYNSGQILNLRYLVFQDGGSSTVNIYAPHHIFSFLARRNSLSD